MGSRVVKFRFQGGHPGPILFRARLVLLDEQIEEPILRRSQLSAVVTCCHDQIDPKLYEIVQVPYLRTSFMARPFQFD